MRSLPDLGLPLALPSCGLRTQATPNEAKITATIKTATLEIFVIYIRIPFQAPLEFDRLINA
jgi:hypothetical protein